MAQHNTITDPNIHEPKGAGTALVGTVYVADGLGSGKWKTIDYVLTFTIQDASVAENYYLIIPVTASIASIQAVINKAFDTNQEITFEVGGTIIDTSTINLIAAGSSAGNIFTSNPTNSSLPAGTALEIINQGGSSAPFTVSLTFLLQT